MKFKFGVMAVALAAAAPLAATPALAHHSFAMFDSTKPMVIEGTVKEYQWTNPHTWLMVDAPYKGKVTTWSIEGGSPNGLARRGWKRTTFKPGDKVKVTINPLKSGDAGGSFVRAYFPDGTLVGNPPGTGPKESD